MRIARERHCDLIHAHGRAAAWSSFLAARLTGIPFVTTWYKGFRDQNLFKHLYNGIMARGDRVIAVSEQLAQLINDRYGTPWERIAVLPSSIDFERFDPAHVTRERVEALRRGWGIKPETKVILVVGRILRRKGHHVMVKAAQRLKEMGFKDFLCVFVGEDRGHTHYTGELWDLVLSTRTMDVVRMAAPVSDMPAAYAAAAVVVSAAIQPEGLQRSIIEAQAMGAAGDRLRSRRRPRRGADRAGRARRPRHRLALRGRRRWRARRGAGAAVLHAGADAAGDRRRAARPGSPAISIRLWSPSRRCGSMPRLPAAARRRPWCRRRRAGNSSNLRALAAVSNGFAYDSLAKVTEPR